MIDLRALHWLMTKNITFVIQKRAALTNDNALAIEPLSGNNYPTVYFYKAGKVKNILFSRRRHA